MNVIIGAGERGQPGWISTQRNQLDVTSAASFSSFLRGAKVDSFLAEHVWEHLTITDGLTAARLCRSHLKPGGRLRLAVPDALNPHPKYIQFCRPGGSGPGADDHKVFYSHVMLRELLVDAGFHTVQPLEWWDEKKVFHQQPWKLEHGFIWRSRRGEPRRWYTSLIMDALA